MAECLGEHFTTPLAPASYAPKDALPREPPGRLVYLLDHQYTERGFGWHRLKGNDALRAAVLRAACERAGCEVVLALAEVHETWSCYEPGIHDRWYGRHRRWTRDEEDDEWTGYEDPASDPDSYDLDELVDWGITLDRWITTSGKQAEPIVARVSDEEVCATTPSVALEPHASEYEGYMGNYGNTMDRWYRRAAVVCWPRERAFAVRAQASPSWALDVVQKRIRARDLAEARGMASELVPFWDGVARDHEQRRLFTRVLRVAHGMDEPELAVSLLRPFRVDALTPKQAPAFVAVVERYGESWTRALISGWSGGNERWTPAGGQDRSRWFASLPRLCESLASDTVTGAAAARLLLHDSWGWLTGEVEDRRDMLPPSQRDEALLDLAQPILGFLESAAVVGADECHREAVSFLCAEENEALLPSMMQMLRLAGRTALPATGAAAGLDAVAKHCAGLLEARLARPPRAGDDWSIVSPDGCGCELCHTLGSFLADPARKSLEWPLAKEGRQHVHVRINGAELPVRHETRRSGRPYCLVLTKTKAVFEREAATRRSHEADLAWLSRRSDPAGGPAPGHTRRRPKDRASTTRR